MNREEFLDKLSEFKDLSWELRDNKIRCQVGEQSCCPITAIANWQSPSDSVPFRIFETRRAGAFIGLDNDVRLEIVRAADKLWRKRLEEYDQGLRKELLKAVGLSEN